MHLEKSINSPSSIIPSDDRSDIWLADADNPFHDRMCVVRKHILLLCIQCLKRVKHLCIRTGQCNNVVFKQIGLCSDISIAVLVAYCSVALDRSVQPQLCILGSMSIGSTISKVEELASALQVAFDAGAKRILIPMSSAVDIPNVPMELFSKFQVSFYKSFEDAVAKALGLE